MANGMGRETMFQGVAELRDALAAPELDLLEQAEAGPPSPEVQVAAHRVARALGYCRLYGNEPGEELDCTLTARAGMAAACDAARLLDAAVEDARQLGRRWDAATNQFEMDLLAADLLELEMDAWAALVAVEESYADSLAADEPEEPEFRSVLERLIDRIEAFDAAVRRQADLLSTLAATPLLENWRNMLAPLYRRKLPWWLDGTLERAAERTELENQATWPVAR